MIWCLLPIILVLLVLASFVSEWQRSGSMFCQALPRPFRDRESQETHWRQAYPNKMSVADALLRTLCEAFQFNVEDRYRFCKSDRIMDVYHSLYPRWKFWKIGDNMEIESLMADVNQQFGVNDQNWHAELTLGEIVELMQSPRGNQGNRKCEV